MDVQKAVEQRYRRCGVALVEKKKRRSEALWTSWVSLYVAISP